MKKHILVIALLSPLTAYSLSPAPAHTLNVEIKNVGAEECKLQRSTLSQGNLESGMIPLVLPPTGESKQFIINGGKTKHAEEARVDALLSLTYQCGSYKKFTLYMKQYYKKSHYHAQIDAEMTDTIDVFETHTTLPAERHMEPNHNNSHPGLISWTISH
ncbi:MAG: hypothetical protein Q8R83_01800 [Legionellaceae bacterium]|nr:hypothetical protein [Legionellaceae bacterium]